MSSQTIYPKKSAYHFPLGPSHESPCMSAYWRAQPIRYGAKREEIVEHEEINEEEVE